MKKVIKIIVALCTILMISVSACAAEISIGSINSNAYDVSVDIVLDEIPSDLLDLSAITIKYNFDDSTFEYVGVTSEFCNDIISTPGTIVWYDLASGTENSKKITRDIFTGSKNVLFRLNFKSETAVLTIPNVEITSVQLADKTLVASSNITVVNDSDAIERVIALINEIGEVAYNEECRIKIDKAYSAYNSLRDDLKTAVTNFYLLEAAKERYDALGPVINTTVNPVFEYGNLYVTVLSNIEEGKKVTVDSNEAQMVKVKEDDGYKICYVIITEQQPDVSEVVIEDGICAEFSIGDIDGAFGITALDALAVNMKAANLDVSYFENNPMTYVKADVNGSGSITALDALMVARIAAGIDVETRFVTDKN